MEKSPAYGASYTPEHYELPQGGDELYHEIEVKKSPEDYELPQSGNMEIEVKKSSAYGMTITNELVDTKEKYSDDDSEIYESIN